MRATTRLRQMLNGPGITVAPGAYDGFSARLIEAAGFQAVYMTGAGTAASHLGQPDLGLTTLTEMAAHAGHLASCVSLPLIADADTGYGNVLNVVRTVREYERAGVAGLHLEDQVAPKKCGHIAGKQVIPAKEFADKIRAAAEYRTDPDFVIIARTDARAVTGLDDAIERGNLYAQAGADVIFVEAPQTEDEIHRVDAAVGRMSSQSRDGAVCRRGRLRDRVGGTAGPRRDASLLGSAWPPRVTVSEAAVLSSEDASHQGDPSWQMPSSSRPPAPASAGPTAAPSTTRMAPPWPATSSRTP